MNKIAMEFVRHVLQQNPDVDSFVGIYDALSRTASARSFHNLGYQELSMAGISFSLLDTGKLEHLITEARRSLSPRVVGQPMARVAQHCRGHGYPGHPAV